MTIPAFLAGNTLATPTIARRRLGRLVARLARLTREELLVLSRALPDVHQLFRDATYLHGPLRKHSARAEELLGLLGEANAAIAALKPTTLASTVETLDPDVLEYAFQEVCYALLHERIALATGPVDRLYAAFEPLITRRDLDRPSDGNGTQ